MFEAWTLRSDDVLAEEERLRDAVSMLEDSQRAAYYRESKRRLRDPDTYAVLNYFFLTGLHHFYLGRHARGLANLLILLAGIATAFVIAPLGIAMVFTILVLEFPNLFRSQIVVADHNNGVGCELLRSLQASSAGHNLAGVERGSAAVD